MSGPPSANAPQPQSRWTVVDSTGDTLPITQSKTSALLESVDPFVGCFSADRPTSTLLSQAAFVPQIFLNEFPSLLLITIDFPRHMPWKCYLCGEENV
jgi:hypothetical protein